jgi:hypothetical protein
MACRRVALDRLAGKAKLEALDEPRLAVEVHLEFVSRTEVGQRLRLDCGDTAEADELGEESLESRSEMISRSRAGSSPAFPKVCQ